MLLDRVSMVESVNTEGGSSDNSGARNERRNWKFLRRNDGEVSEDESIIGRCIKNIGLYVDLDLYLYLYLDFTGRVKVI